MAEWHHQAATRGPSWPHEGWTIGRGITDGRKRAQREALANGISGYLAATPVGRPDSGERSEQMPDVGSSSLRR